MVGRWREERRGVKGEGRVKKRKEIFFFKQKTAYEIYQCDWSSDVCSSDLNDHAGKAI